MFMVTLLQVLLLFLSAHPHILVAFSYYKYEDVARNTNEDCNAYSTIVRRVNEQIVGNAKLTSFNIHMVCFQSLKDRIAEMQSQLDSMKGILNITQENLNNNEEKLNQVSNTLAEKSKEFNQINADRLKNMTAFKEQTEKHLNELVLLLTNSSSDPDQTLIERIIRLEKLHDKIRVDILRILDLQNIISDVENQLMAALKRIKENDAKFRECAHKCANLDGLNDLIDRLEDMEQRIFGSTSGKNPTSSTTTTTTATTSTTPIITKPTASSPHLSFVSSIEHPNVVGIVGSVDNPIPIYGKPSH